jgi:hypothetical protein
LLIASDPTYREPPQKFNSPEWVEMATQVLKANPRLETIQFPGVSYRDALIQRGQILARLAMGEKAFGTKDLDAAWHDNFRSVINAWNKTLRSGEDR